MGGRSRINDKSGFDGGFEDEESPFDMAPEMNMQLFKGQSIKVRD
jgi:hypothetical protein